MVTCSGRRVLLGLMLTLLVLPAAGRPSVRGNVQHRFTFSGSGRKTLAPFRVRKPSTLHWKAKGRLFEIVNATSSSGDLDSRSASGANYMPPGRYRLRVKARAPWQITIAPGIEHPHLLPFQGHNVGFSGSGGRDLPPFITTRDFQGLSWHDTGGLFQLFSKGSNGPDVNSRAGLGSATMSAGIHQVTVNAVGYWWIVWTP